MVHEGEAGGDKNAKGFRIAVQWQTPEDEYIPDAMSQFNLI
jgi:hypothetical protein